MLSLIKSLTHNGMNTLQYTYMYYIILACMDGYIYIVVPSHMCTYYENVIGHISMELRKWLCLISKLFSHDLGTLQYYTLRSFMSTIPVV